jgi:hypothetical protein
MIGHGNFWKVGVTRTDIEERLKTLQTGFPHVLEIAATWTAPDCLWAERKAHALLEQYHYRAEWFCGEKEVLLQILKGQRGDSGAGEPLDQAA